MFVPSTPTPPRTRECTATPRLLDNFTSTQAGPSARDGDGGGGGGSNSRLRHLPQRPRPPLRPRPRLPPPPSSLPHPASPPRVSRGRPCRELGRGGKEGGGSRAAQPVPPAAGFGFGVGGREGSGAPAVGAGRFPRILLHAGSPAALTSDGAACGKGGGGGSGERSPEEEEEKGGMPKGAGGLGEGAEPCPPLPLSPQAPGRVRKLGLPLSLTPALCSAFKAERGRRRREEGGGGRNAAM